MEWNSHSHSLRSMVSAAHAVMQATPMQLVFGHDTTFSVQHRSNLKHVHDRKQKMSRINNQRREPRGFLTWALLGT
jgi:hypothetical protein